MRVLSWALTGLLFLTSFHPDKAIELDRQEAQDAFAFLNEVRANPAAYYKELRYKKSLKTSPVMLRWNDTLARVAEEKALDMAERNYFAHVDPDRKGINYLVHQAGYELHPDWLKKKSENNFESIAANAKTGVEAIKMLIIDENEPSLGHRKHLLGLDEWNAPLKDVGIGFVRCSSGCRYKSYVSVIIARQSW
jgi:uncharacterized protein YkwD